VELLAGANEAISEALGDYGTALGVILQLIDDCRDAFSHSDEIITGDFTSPFI
jgi:geranylgeranyl pyrophosphate synthase